MNLLNKFKCKCGSERIIEIITRETKEYLDIDYIHSDGDLSFDEPDGGFDDEYDEENSNITGSEFVCGDCDCDIVIATDLDGLMLILTKKEGE